MNKSPAFQFYPKDWLSSATIQMMPPEYEGAYIRLLAYCWESGDCSLPDDDDALARLSRLGEGWLKGGCNLVRKCFIPHPKKPGFLTNERLYNELQKQEVWRKKSSKGGKKSALKRAEDKASARVVEKCLVPNSNISSSSSSSSDKERFKLHSTEITPREAEVLKNEKLNKGSFDVSHYFTDHTPEEARKAAPKWDIYHLVQVFNESVKSGRLTKPAHPAKAFVGWCKIYTKGKEP